MTFHIKKKHLVGCVLTIYFHFSYSSKLSVTLTFVKTCPTRA